MQLWRSAENPWGQEVLIGVSWNLMWAALIGAAFACSLPQQDRPSAEGIGRRQNARPVGERTVWSHVVLRIGRNF